MSAPGREDGRPALDPFRAEDPAAVERERRRLQREAKRRSRENRESLASRVGGVLEGAASRGREAIDERRERARDPEPPSEGAEPPPLRSAPAAPIEPEEPRRLSAEVVMPPRPPRVPVPQTEDAEALPPEPVAAESRRAPSESEEWSVPPPIEPPPARGGGGARRVPGRGGSSWALWRRRLLALVAIVAIAGVALYALGRAGSEDAPPPPPGPKTLKTTSVTIPEGLTAEEIAGVAKEAGLKGSYADAVEGAEKKFDVTKLGAPKDAGLEGFLFPATYEVERGAPVSDLVRKQLTEGFDANFSEVDMSYAKKKNLSVYDVVTIASMIEREAAVEKERPLVAAVIYNRLADGEPLGIDATLRYEYGYDKPLTESALAADTPYNTRINTGLPPTPISNPGLASLQAAARPANVDYKYYVFKPGSCNEHTFTASYAEFQRLDAAYQAALEAQGGQPSNC